MSVLIRGMEMPTSCDDCRFAVDGWCYACIPESDAERQRITTNYCPLINIPPHGRCIDADALVMQAPIVGKLMMFGGEYVYTQSEIDRAPTIIPAESEEGE